MTYTRLLPATGLLTAFLVAGCPIPPPPVPPSPAPPAPSCEQLCDHWRALGCEEAEPTPNGEPCEVLCEVMGDTWDTACMIAVDSCDDIEDC